MDHVKINYMGFYRIRFLLPVHLNALVGGRVMYMYVCAGNSVRVCVCVPLLSWSCVWPIHAERTNLSHIVARAHWKSKPAPTAFLSPSLSLFSLNFSCSFFFCVLAVFCWIYRMKRKIMIFVLFCSFCPWLFLCCMNECVWVVWDAPHRGQCQKHNVCSKLLLFSFAISFSPMKFQQRNVQSHKFIFIAIYRSLLCSFYDYIWIFFLFCVFVCSFVCLYFFLLCVCVCVSCLANTILNN